MNAIDRLLQRWRIAKAARHIPAGSRVLDVGCADGALFRQLKDRISGGVGIDREPPDIASPYVGFVRGEFPGAIEETETYDVVTLLAVAEHIPDDAQSAFADACARVLKRGGKLIITVPSPLVDPILDWLIRLRILHGMSVEEHHGFDIRRVAKIFSVGGLSLVEHSRFQMGLNNLYVFQKK